LHAVIRAESAYDPFAVSHKGAVGLMQLMPDTARRYGVSNLTDPVANLQGGSRYLRDLLRLFKQNLRLALAAYNAGENAVIRHGHKIPPYQETRLYVEKALRYYRQYQAVL
jgi:soluble lytic murein transglycosylase-like protein